MPHCRAMPRQEDRSGWVDREVSGRGRRKVFGVSEKDTGKRGKPVKYK